MCQWALNQCLVMFICLIIKPLESTSDVYGCGEVNSHPQNETALLPVKENSTCCHLPMCTVCEFEWVCGSHTHARTHTVNQWVSTKRVRVCYNFWRCFTITICGNIHDRNEQSLYKNKPSWQRPTHILLCWHRSLLPNDVSFSGQFTAQNCTVFEILNKL